MNKQTIHKMIVTFAVCSIGFLPLSAIAVQDEFQRQMTQQVMKAKQKLKEAEAAKGAERQKLMGEHMQVMKENMEKCRTMQPKAGLSEKEREEWLIEHRKIMQEIMDQMMQQHHMQMGMECMSKSSGDTHKH